LSWLHDESIYPLRCGRYFASTLFSHSFLELLLGHFRELLEDIDRAIFGYLGSHGDNKVFSIALASIIAKVTRDKMMEEYHKQYPLYGFDRHKGYGTKLHFEMLKKYGPCKIHRKSFKPVSCLINQS